MQSLCCIYSILLKDICVVCSSVECLLRSGASLHACRTHCSLCLGLSLRLCVDSVCFFSTHIINTWWRTVCLTTSLSLRSAVRPSALSSFNYCGDAESHSGLTFFFLFFCLHKHTRTLGPVSRVMPFMPQCALLKCFGVIACFFFYLPFTRN